MFGQKLAKDSFNVSKDRKCDQGRSKLFAQKDDAPTVLLSSAEECMVLMTLLGQPRESPLMAGQSMVLGGKTGRENAITGIST